MLKQKLTRRNKIANVGVIVIETNNQSYNKRMQYIHDWVGKVIHKEFFKKFKFYHMNKWYMHNAESVLDNETHKVLWDCGIQTGT